MGFGCSSSLRASRRAWRRTRRGRSGKRDRLRRAQLFDRVQTHTERMPRLVATDQADRGSRDQRGIRLQQRSTRDQCRFRGVRSRMGCQRVQPWLAGDVPGRAALGRQEQRSSVCINHRIRLFVVVVSVVRTLKTNWGLVVVLRVDHTVRPERVLITSRPLGCSSA